MPIHSHPSRSLPIFSRRAYLHAALGEGLSGGAGQESKRAYWSHHRLVLVSYQNAAAVSASACAAQALPEPSTWHCTRLSAQPPGRGDGMPTVRRGSGLSSLCHSRTCSPRTSHIAINRACKDYPHRTNFLGGKVSRVDFTLYPRPTIAQCLRGLCYRVQLFLIVQCPTLLYRTLYLI